MSHTQKTIGWRNANAKTHSKISQHSGGLTADPKKTKNQHSYGWHFLKELYPWFESKQIQYTEGSKW